MDNVEKKMENVNISEKKAKGGKKSKGKDECCDVKLEVSRHFLNLGHRYSFEIIEITVV
jgi:hypothetical protein